MLIEKKKNIFLNEEFSKITDAERNHCEGPVTYCEALSAVKKMANNKTPGSDGITIEFYKFFWKDICNTLLDSFSYAFIKGELSIDQKRGILTLTPKKDKNRYFLKNWTYCIAQ